MCQSSVGIQPRTVGERQSFKPWLPPGVIVANGALYQRKSEEGAFFFVVKSSFLMGAFMTGALGKWVRVGGPGSKH